MKSLVRLPVFLAVLFASFTASAQKLVVFNELGGSSPREYYTFDPATGATVLLSTQASPERFFSLETQPSTGVIYGIEPGASALYKVNVNTGSATFVAPTGLASIANITFHPTTGVLYAVGRGSSNLYTIDHVSGASTLIGDCAPVRAGLEFSPSGTLYGTDSIGTLYTINPSTAVPTLIGGGSGPTLVEDAEFTAAGKLYLTDYNGSIHEVNPASGASVTVGNTGLGNGLLGIVEEPESCGKVNYCTAGTSASGCQALLSATGTASATAASGFNLMASTVEGQKDGLFFFGTNGQQANPWGNGTSYQCVVPPVKRCGLLAGTGTIGACDGSLSQDLNALWCPTCPKPNHNPGVGVVAQAQLWYRDPLSTSNQTTSLSDAIQFCVGP